MVIQLKIIYTLTLKIDFYRRSKQFILNLFKIIIRNKKKYLLIITTIINIDYFFMNRASLRDFLHERTLFSTNNFLIFQIYYFI